MDEILYVGSRSESMGHFNKKKHLSHVVYASCILKTMNLQL